MDWLLRKMRPNKIKNELKRFAKLSRREISWVKTIRETLAT